MGVDITSKVIVGYTYDEIRDYVADKYEEDSVEFEEALDSILEELDDISPWFDAQRLDKLWGVSVAYDKYTAVELTDEHFNFYKVLKSMLTKRFGIEPKLYAGAHVW